MLDLLPLLGIALGLAMDAFSVALAAGVALESISPRQTFRLSFHFGLFQFLMPIIGWLAGSTVAAYISAYDHWLALALLTYVGGKMIWESFSGEEERLRGDPTRWPTLVILAVATSIDALAVGFSLALLMVPVLYPAAVIGVVAGVLTIAGMQLGKRVGSLFGIWMERVGGLVLIGIGVKIVIEHTLG